LKVVDRIGTHGGVNPIVPCVWLDDQAEAAAAFYVVTFPNGRIAGVSRYPESMDNPTRKPRGSVLTVEVELAGQRFSLLNGGPTFRPSPSISFFVHVAGPGDADRIYAALADGGEALMPIGTYPWSERYGWVKDRFGVTWQVMAGRAYRELTIVPSLMFRGRAAEAMETYTQIFVSGRIHEVTPFAEGEGPTDFVKHASFVLDGQPMAAMDSPIEHAFGFDEGLSLQVMCKDQAEVDHFWEGLVAGGGEHGRCGWLKDRFGLSWQVNPREMNKYIGGPDPDGAARAMAAMMKMEKLVVADLRAAYEGS